MHGSSHHHHGESGGGFFKSLRRMFELDLRSLAVARIGLGFLGILDCIFRLQNFEAHYSDLGVMPLHILQSFYRPQGPCLHCWSDADNWGIALLGLQLAFSLLMMLGWKTRTSVFFTWLLSISLQYRNPLVIDGGDVLYRCFLLWMLFLPVGAYYSIDARRHPPASTRTTHWLNIILPLQLFMLYFFSGLLKTGADWWPLGTATGYALSLDAFVTPFGRWLTQFPETLKVLTRAVYLTELWAPFLLLAGGRARLLGILIFFGFHAGLGLAMDLALFPWISAACLCALLPKEFWEILRRPALAPRFPVTRLQHACSVLAVPFFLAAVSWNVATLYKVKLPRLVSQVGKFVHVDQYWGMFAPYPLKDSGWYEFGVRLWSGEYVYAFVDDRMENAWNLEKERPKQGNTYFVDQRWRKYLINLWDRTNAKFRPALAEYLCRKWNRDFPAPSDKAQSVDIEFTLYENKEYLMPARGPSNIDLGTYSCD